MKYPCVECDNECKIGTLQCQACGEWCHPVCSTIPAAVLNVIPKNIGLIWLCKHCKEPGKAKLKNMSQEDVTLEEKINKIEKNFESTNDKMDMISTLVKTGIDEKFNIIERALNDKLNNLFEKQDAITRESENNWSKIVQQTQKPIELKSIMQETLALQEKEKIENERREANIILYRVPESKKAGAVERMKEDTDYFNNFCEEGLQLDPKDTLKIIRLGAHPVQEAESDIIPAPRPMKIVLKDKMEKQTIFKNLKNLKNTSFSKISVSEDYSQDTREQMKQKLLAAKKSDGELAKTFIYRFQGPAWQLELKRYKRKNIPETTNDQETVSAQ